MCQMSSVCSHCKGDGETGSLEVARYLSVYVYSAINSSWVRLTTFRLKGRHALEWPHSILASQARVVVRLQRVFMSECYRSCSLMVV